MANEQVRTDEMVDITKVCPICGEEHTVSVYKKDWDLFNQPDRPLIQDIFPYLTAPEREIIMTGIDGNCFREMFGGDDDE